MSGPNNGHKTDGRAIEAAHKTAEACELRLQGYTFPEIAEKLGYAGRQGAHAAVMRGIREIMQEPAEDVRRQELERLNKIWHAFYRAASEGDLNAADMCLKVMARRAKYLGIEAPEKSITATAELNGDNVEVSTLVQRMLRSVDGRIAACELVEESAQQPEPTERAKMSNMAPDHWQDLQTKQGIPKGESSHVPTNPDGTSEPNSGT